MLTPSVFSAEDDEREGDTAPPDVAWGEMTAEEIEEQRALAQVGVCVVGLG